MNPEEGQLLESGDPALCLFASEALTKRLWALLDEAGGVRENLDPEYLHRMRVASRRLRNAMDLFSGCFPSSALKAWEKEARRLAKVLGEARDADVAIASLRKCLESLGDPRLKPGVERLLLRLAQRRERCQVKVTAALDHLEDSRLKTDMPEALRGLAVEMRLSGLEESSGVVAAHALRTISRRFAEFEAFDPVADHPERIDELHSMRIAAKHLRYTLEVYRPLFAGRLAQVLDRLKTIQDFLGEIHDCDVWMAFLPDFIERERQRTLRYFGHARSFARLKPGLAHLQEDYRERRRERFEAFRELWRETKTVPWWAGIVSELGKGTP